jgi:DNA-binding XRE family transcriptional regulator
MKRISRGQRLTPEEAAKFNEIRRKVDAELPEIIERHRQRMATRDCLDDVMLKLKAAREAKGLSLNDVSEAVGMDRSALSKLENGHRPNPTVETLVRYAEAVGKRLVVTLADSRPQST